MIGYDFTYCGRNLSSLGFMMANPENDDSNGLNRELLKGNATSYRKEANHYGAKYTDVIVLNFFVVKQVDLYPDSKVSYRDMRTLQAWLTSADVPSPLLIEFDDYSRLEYLGVFTNIVPYYYNGLNGFNLTFTCNSPFAYKREKVTIKVEKFGSPIVKKIICDTDENDFIYPTITLSNIKAGGEYRISSKEEGNSMSLSIDNSHSQYVIDCKLKRVLIDDVPATLHEIGWDIKNITDYNNVATGTFKAYWLRLVPYKNTLTFSENADCVIEYKSPIKALGGYIYV